MSNITVFRSIITRGLLPASPEFTTMWNYVVDDVAMIVDLAFNNILLYTPSQFCSNISF